MLFKVRKIAEDNGIKVAHKRGSAGVCFIGRRSLPDFLGIQLYFIYFNFIESTLIMKFYLYSAIYRW